MDHLTMNQFQLILKELLESIHQQIKILTAKSNQYLEEVLNLLILLLEELDMVLQLRLISIGNLILV